MTPAGNQRPVCAGQVSMPVFALRDDGDVLRWGDVVLGAGENVAAHVFLGHRELRRDGVPIQIERESFTHSSSL